VDLDTITRIREEGLNRSRVMDTARHLTDVLGPRLTGSPQAKAANEWTRQRLEEWGLSNARIEGYPFGSGWSLERVEVRMTAPRVAPLYAIPKAWTPGTDGPVAGPAERIDLKTEEDLEQHKGKLAGKILLLDEAREIEKNEATVQRFSDAELEDLWEFDIPDGRPPDWRAEMRKRVRLSQLVNELLVEERALATVEISSWDHGIVRVRGGGTYGRADRSPGVPALVMAAEQYDQIVRLLEHGDVELEIEVEARFHEGDRKAYNTLADIPGSARSREVVMAGAHLDSWHAGTGASDNAAGCAVVMEAARILHAVGARPRRTIRFALWTGEEQGYQGSRAYVDQRLATRPEPQDPEQLALPPGLRDPTWPITVLPGHRNFSAYFNVDNGSGRIRGIYAQENASVRPIFEAWLAPLADLGATTVTLESTRGTDHVPFDAVGLPAFQFVQDGLDYMSRTHHTQLDVYDYLRREDLVQASVVLATFLYHAAMRPERLPRKPMPRGASAENAAPAEEVRPAQEGPPAEDAPAVPARDERKPIQRPG
jgi:hypothetical protein